MLSMCHSINVSSTASANSRNSGNSSSTCDAMAGRIAEDSESCLPSSHGQDSRTRTSELKDGTLTGWNNYTNLQLLAVSFPCKVAALCKFFVPSNLHPTDNLIQTVHIMHPNGFSACFIGGIRNAFQTLILSIELSNKYWKVTLKGPLLQCERTRCWAQWWASTTYKSLCFQPSGFDSQTLQDIILRISWYWDELHRFA